VFIEQACHETGPLMRISHDQLEKGSLAALGVEVVQLLCAGKFSDLAERFGYALAFEREPATAIEEELALCLVELQATALTPIDNHIPKVSYFKPNDTGLVALIELMVPANNGRGVLVELIVTGKGAERHVTLEQLSVTA
jgi:hypothetical protein